MPTARQSVPKHMTLARDPPVAIRRFSLFSGEVGLADFSISIVIRFCHQRSCDRASKPFFSIISIILPEQCPYRSRDEGFNQRRIAERVHFSFTSPTTPVGAVAEAAGTGTTGSLLGLSLYGLTHTLDAGWRVSTPRHCGRVKQTRGRERRRIFANLAAPVMTLSQICYD